MDINRCNVIGVLVMNKTTRVPKSVFHDDVDKDLTSVYYSVFTQSCFPNKNTNRQRRAKQFILFTVNSVCNTWETGDIDDKNNPLFFWKMQKSRTEEQG